MSLKRQRPAEREERDQLSSGREMHSERKTRGACLQTRAAGAGVCSTPSIPEVAALNAWCRTVGGVQQQLTHVPPTPQAGQRVTALPCHDRGGAARTARLRVGVAVPA